MNRQQTIFADRADTALAQLIADGRTCIVVADTNTARHCLPLLPSLAGVPAIIIDAGEQAKTVDTLLSVYTRLIDLQATRATRIIALGGGVVTDLAGFAAATFKRGLTLVNVPTTILAAVDAAVGGKTGINFGPLKNEIGVFAPAENVVISTDFFPTLPRSERLAGFAEMIKHALLDSPQALAKLLSSDTLDCDSHLALSLLRTSVAVKQRYVNLDPRDRGPRHALNLGHTAAHAVEALLAEQRKPVAHGIAVAWGLVVELVLSRMTLNFPSDHLYTLARFVADHYPACPIVCDDYPQLLQFMAHDKKNTLPDQINFTLLRNIGDPQINCHIAPPDITAALDIFRDLTGA